MGSKVTYNCFIKLVVFILCFCSLVHSLDNNKDTETLNSLLQDFAFRSLIKHKPQNGALYDAFLPQNLSGMHVSVVHLRSQRVWRKGANFSFFQIPPRTMFSPHVRRLVIVYQNLGNRSSQFYNLQGYSLISYVVGFMVFDASNVTDARVKNLNISTMGQPISIHFPNVTFLGGIKSRVRCVAFSANGTIQVSLMISPGLCYSKDQGHFSVVLQLESKPQRQWYLLVIGFVIGFVGLIAVVYAGFSCTRFLKAKRIQAIERHANEDLVLESRWVGNSKLPSAAVTRTQPAYENSVL
ncbi:hypothetical protein TanjilG_04881 [Lupinus angustifolius]|uniref:Legume lectin domain-containing protein n=1 Tax=Lupinus angustifolius TaxID=3871 RepID=A0A4P1QS91_LUPAN|nr:PREDICTED: uncharacterized protein LOC109332664 [Lupinus angustifolius]OIV93649.1 hypothetical protein TanjilG_04881 [Lupinus angustifolius]